MHLPRISKRRAAFNAVICFVLGVPILLAGGSTIGVAFLISAAFFAGIVAWKNNSDRIRAQIGMTYQYSLHDDATPPTTSHSTGVYDPNDL